jgi:hypothetical protein
MFVRGELIENSGGKQGRKFMKETMADKGIGSRHVEKGIQKC